MALSGCAAIQPAEPSGASAAPAHALLLVAMPMRRDEAQLREQFAAKLPADSPGSRQAIEEAAGNAETQAFNEMREALARRAGIAVDDGAAIAPALARLRLRSSDVVITKDLAQRLHALSGDDELVRFRISDYGVAPKAWRKGYIAFEVASTLAIAALVYYHPATRPLAGVYLVEEAVEETAEGYAGFWAIDEVARPVRLEAELVCLDDGDPMWKGAATGLSDIRLGRLVRKVGRAEQDEQRADALAEAVRKLAADIEQGVARGSCPRAQKVPG